MLFNKLWHATFAAILSLAAAMPLPTSNMRLSKAEGVAEPAALWFPVSLEDVST
jgi:hypothetical protein